MPRNKFADIITATRRRRGLSQKQAALELGISQALLSHYENGIRECNLDFLVKLSDYYGVTCDYLLGHSTSKSSRTVSAQRQRTYTRTLETMLLMVERTDDEKLRQEISGYIKNCLYRCLKLFDGMCDGLKFEGDDHCIAFAGGEAEICFTRALRVAYDLKDMEIPLHESSLESPMRIINSVETQLKEKELL